MTREEINKLLALMKANYSYAFKTMSQQEKYMLLNTWTFALQDLDAGIVMIAAMQLISTSKWLPTVAEIREKIRGLYYDAAAARLDADYDLLSEGQKQHYEYIIGHTSHLRGEGDAGLQLRSILENPAFSLEVLGALEEEGAACSPMLNG